MEDTKINDIVKNLKTNPVFNMSLSSKELFHSNVLAWLLDQYPDGELAELFIPEGYAVLRVLREWKNFDLFIICAKKEDKELLSEIDFSEEDSDNNEKIKSNGLGIRIENKEFKKFAEINDFEKLKNEVEILKRKDKLKKNEQTKINRFEELEAEEKEIKKLNNIYNACKDCKFIIIENKIKSLPYDKQLKKYIEKIKKGDINFLQVLRASDKNIKINLQNTSFKLFAPKGSLDIFFERTNEHIKKYWQGVSYDEMCLKLPEKCSDEFTREFIIKYKGFVEAMLKITKRVFENKTQVFPPKDDKDILRTIRIHDFYEKLWYSNVLYQIDAGNTKESTVGYSNGSGMLNFHYALEKDVGKNYGIEIQVKQFRFFCFPADDNIYEKLFKMKKEWLEILEQEGKLNGITKDMEEHKRLYKDFKYDYQKLPDNCTIEQLSYFLKVAKQVIERNI